MRPDYCALLFNRGLEANFFLLESCYSFIVSPAISYLSHQLWWFNTVHSLGRALGLSLAIVSRYFTLIKVLRYVCLRGVYVPILTFQAIMTSRMPANGQRTSSSSSDRGNMSPNQMGKKPANSSDESRPSTSQPQVPANPLRPGWTLSRDSVSFYLETQGLYLNSRSISDHV